MKPCYEDEAVTLYHGRCEDILPERWCAKTAQRLSQEVFNFGGAA